MNSLYIRDFRYGLDTRKSELTQRPGSLEKLLNAFINQGGEIENRLAFVRTARVAGTFGLQSTSSGLYTFGSLNLSGSHPVNIGTVGIPVNVNYQRLQHPAVLFDASLYSAGSHDMTAVSFSGVFRGKAFVQAVFADGTSYGYYDGTILGDFTKGIVTNFLSDNVKLSKWIVDQINETENYAATQLTFATVTRQIVAEVATLEVASTLGLVVGQTVKITGLPAAYNKVAATLTGVTATTISYAVAGAGNEVNTPDVAGLITSSLIAVTSEVGNEFGIVTKENSAGGSFGTPTITSTSTPGSTGASAIGSFRITGGKAGGAATGTLTRSGVIANGHTVTIGTKVYTFVTTITNVEGQVLVATGDDVALQNLVDAINHTNVGGVAYYCAAANEDVEAGAIAASAFSVAAKIGGTGGNSIATMETSAGLSWGAATLTGGVASATANQISSIEVVSPAGVRTNILQAAVDFISDVPTTCAAVVAAINAYTDTSGYTASLTGSQVFVYSDIEANPQPNNYNLVVTCKGNVCIGQCFMRFTPSSAGVLSVTGITVDGVEVMGTGVALTTVNPPTVTKVYSTIEAQINAGTIAGVAHGVIANARAGYLQLSRRVTSSADISTAVFVQFAAGSGGVEFVDDPNKDVTPSSFTVGLSQTSFATSLTEQRAITDINDWLYVTAIPSGGSGIYEFKWFPFAASVNLADELYEIYLSPESLDGAIIQLLNKDPNLPGTLIAAFQIYNGGTNSHLPTAPFINGPGSNLNILNRGLICSFSFRCRVTDSTGAVALSDVLTITMAMF